MSTQTELPESFAAGTTVKYTRSVADYPASSGWTLSLSLAGPGVLTVTSSASGADHAVTITATQTAALSPGRYRWAETVTKADEVYRVATGYVQIEPHLDAAMAGDHQSVNERLLAAVEAAIAARLSTSSSSSGSGGSLPRDIEAYSIDGISVTKIPLADLEKHRTRLAFAVVRERHGGIGRQHRIAFTSGDS